MSYPPQHTDAERALADAVCAFFQSQKAQRIDTPILHPAQLLSEVYGDAILARAMVVHPPGQTAHVLRPDFTVPIAQYHIDAHTTQPCPMRYTYAGKVFRAPPPENAHPNPQGRESYQAGFELLDGQSAVDDDAEVFSTLYKAVFECGKNSQYRRQHTHITTSDMGVLIDAVDALDTSRLRIDALLRHIWRPNRFKRLLNRFAEMPKTPFAPVPTDSTHIGTRSSDEIAQHFHAWQTDARDVPPLLPEIVRIVLDLLALQAPYHNAQKALLRMAMHAEQARALPFAEALHSAAKRLEHYQQKLAERGIDTKPLCFDVNYGSHMRMEYYNGFVFAITCKQKPNRVLALGGRYDALIRVLQMRTHTQARFVLAVGGIVRPREVLQLDRDLGL